MRLSKHEEIILLELAKESKGLGWPVAVYPFESNIRALKMETVDANLAMAGLQNRGLVRLEDRAGMDEMENRPTLYPVFVLTKDGFTAALGIRKRKI